MRVRIFFTDLRHVLRDDQEIVVVDPHDRMIDNTPRRWIQILATTIQFEKPFVDPE